VPLFEGSERYFRTCFYCRNRQTPVLTPPQHLLAWSEFNNEFLEPEQRGDVGICLDVDILLDKNLRILTDDQVKEFILDKVQLLDGYEYFWKHHGVPKLKFAATFEAVCSQDTNGKLREKQMEDY
jgi:hypothetical protein